MVKMVSLFVMHCHATLSHALCECLYNYRCQSVRMFITETLEILQQTSKLASNTTAALNNSIISIENQICKGTSVFNPFPTDGTLMYRCINMLLMTFYIDLSEILV